MVSSEEGNKVNLKTGLQENKAHHIFLKTIISHPLIRIRACAYQSIKSVIHLYPSSSDVDTFFALFCLLLAVV